MSPDVLLIQETWHTADTPIEVTGYTCYISPPNTRRSQGVFTLISKKFQEARAIMKDLWTTQQNAILVKISEEVRFVLVNHYTDCLDVTGGDQTLSRLTKSIKEQYPDSPIVLGGDLNRCPDMA